MLQPCLLHSSQGEISRTHWGKAARRDSGWRSAVLERNPRISSRGGHTSTACVSWSWICHPKLKKRNGIKYLRQSVISMTLLVRKNWAIIIIEVLSILRWLYLMNLKRLHVHKLYQTEIIFKETSSQESINAARDAIASLRVEKIFCTLNVH